MQGERQLVPNVWSVIFSNLEPCFLFNVMQVSKSFNAAASHDIVFYKKLKQYFPEHNMELIRSLDVPPNEVNHKAKAWFKKLYSVSFKNLKSSASRRLWSYIMEEDLEQIRKFPVDGDALFEMLKEEDIPGQDMLFYINRAKNPALVSEIMKLYVRSAVARAQSWNPLIIFDNWLDSACRKVFGVPLNNNECVHVYELLAAFNLPVVSVFEKINPDLYWLYDNALVQAIRFGYMETVDMLLNLSGRFPRANDRHFALDNNYPLIVAAKYKQPEVAKRLLEVEEIAADYYNIQRALFAACKYRSPTVFTLLLDAYFNVLNPNPHNQYHLILELLSRIISEDRVDNFSMVMKKMVECLGGHPMYPAVFFQDMKRLSRMVSSDGKYCGMIEVMLQTIQQIYDEKHVKQFMRDVMWYAVRDGRVDIMHVFLRHGYVPHKDLIAQVNHHPRQYEIFRLLSDARAERKAEQAARLAP